MRRLFLTGLLILAVSLSCINNQPTELQTNRPEWIPVNVDEVNYVRQLAYEFTGDDDEPAKAHAGDDDTPDTQCSNVGPPLCKKLADDVDKCRSVCNEIYYIVAIEDELVCVRATGASYNCNGY